MNRILATLAVLSIGCSTPAVDSPDAAVLGGVGAACTADTECRTGLTCFLGPDGARAWPAGYCTRPCSADDCPGAAVCGEAYSDPSAASVYYCLASCDRLDGERGGCREGYFCMFDGACHVGCVDDGQCESIDFDQGPAVAREGSTCELESGRCLRGSESGGGNVGDVCTSDAECQGPSGACIGGTCYRGSCDLGGRYACGAGEECVAWRANEFQQTFFCVRSCAIGVDGVAGAPGRCRASEACVPSEQDYSGMASEPYCFPTPGGGVAGSTTATVGSPCTSERDCPNPLGYTVCSDGICQIRYCAVASLAAQDLCGPDGACLTFEVSAGASRFLIHDAALGVCERDCSADPSACEGGTTCVDGYCLP